MIYKRGDTLFIDMSALDRKKGRVGGVNDYKLLEIRSNVSTWRSLLESRSKVNTWMSF